MADTATLKQARSMALVKDIMELPCDPPLNKRLIGQTADGLIAMCELKRGSWHQVGDAFTHAQIEEYAIKFACGMASVAAYKNGPVNMAIFIAYFFARMRVKAGA